MTCRNCGCSDHDACITFEPMNLDGTEHTAPVPCYWVEDELCSACAEFEEALLDAIARGYTRQVRAYLRDPAALFRRAGTEGLVQPELPPEPTPPPPLDG